MFQRIEYIAKRTWAAHNGPDVFFKARGHKTGWVEKRGWIWEEFGDKVNLIKLH